MSQFTAAAALAGELARAGTSAVFGLPGGGPNLDLVGAAAGAGLDFVLTHGETAAVIMAATSADLAGTAGAAVVTRGPGLASAMNGIAHAALDRLPVVVIADTVPAADASRISHQRLDQVALAGSVAKAVVTVGNQRAPEAARDAVRLALAPPPGPVIALTDGSVPAGAPGRDAVRGRDTPGPDAEGDCAGDDLAPLDEALRTARRPVVVLGSGAIGHTAAVRAALTGLGVPVLHTYRARGILPDSADEAAGLVTGGTMEWPLLAAADLIIGLGVDPAELIPASWDYPARIVLVTGAGWPGGTAYFTRPAAQPATGPQPTGLTAPLPAAIKLVAGARHDWPPAAGRTARADAARGLAGAASAAPGLLAPQQVAATVRAGTPPETIAAVDSGAHMLAVMPLWEVGEPRRLLISSGLATMGFALPAAIAAARLSPDVPVVAFTGDGGLGMVLAEIETAVRLGLRIVIVACNDSALSLIRIKQLPAGHGGSEAVSYRPVSFAATATAMGAAGVTVTGEPGLRGALTAALCRDGPTVIDARVDPACYPAIMDLTRGAAGRRQVAGLPPPVSPPPAPGPARPRRRSRTAGTPG